MAEHSLLAELLMLAAVGVVTATLLSRLRLPIVAGLLLAGALAGPHALGLVNDVAGIQQIAEFGVVLLLFSIGLEFSGQRLHRMGRSVLLGGVLQVFLTLTAAVAIGIALGLPIGRALFFGFIFALSSTAIVLRIYTDSSEIDSPHGRLVIGTLIFQDIAVVLFVLATPLLAGEVANPWPQAGLVLLRAVALVGMALLASRYLIGRVLELVDNTRSRELFILATVTICIGMAWISSLAGLSLALGAFLAGVTIASSDFAHRALGEMLPLRDVLASLFFISLGMLFDWRVLFTHPIAVLLLLFAFVAGKALLAMLAALLSGFPARTAWLAGVALGQFGEFSFVMAQTGQAAGLLGQDQLPVLLAAGILSMFLTPLLIQLAPRLEAPAMAALRPFEALALLRARLSGHVEAEHDLAEHVVIAGYGPAGRLLARVLALNGIPYAVVDLNLDNVRLARRNVDSVVYGDITQPDTMRRAHLAEAQAVLVMFNDPEGLPRTLDALRREAPGVPVMLRCRYQSQARQLIVQGADMVVIEEAEVGLTMLRRLLRHVGLSDTQIREQIVDTRRRLDLNTQTGAAGLFAISDDVPEHAAD